MKNRFNRVASSSLRSFCNQLVRSHRPTRLVSGSSLLLMLVLLCLMVPHASSQSDANRFVLSRENRTIAFEPYGAGIIRITLSTNQAAATEAPGYGITGSPSMAGWTREQGSDGRESFRSGELVVRVAPQDLPQPRHLPLDSINQKLRDIYFPPGNRGAGQATTRSPCRPRPANRC